MSILGGANSFGDTGTIGNATNPGAGQTWQTSQGVGADPNIPQPRGISASGSGPVVAPQPQVAPLQQFTLASDPSYLSYLRTMGLSESSARANAERSVGNVNRQLALQVPSLQRQGIENIRGIDNGFEGRGVFRSGERLRQDAQSQANTEAQIGAANAGAAGQIGDIYNQRDQQLQQLQVGLANAASEGQNRVGSQNAYLDYMNKAGLLSGAFLSPQTLRMLATAGMAPPVNEGPYF